MSEKLEEARRCYEEVPIPAELNARVNLEVQRSRRRRLRRRRWTQAAASLAGCAAAFVLVVNFNPTFAAALEPVPVLGDLVRIITGEVYHVDNEETYLDIRTPVLQNTGNSELEDRINEEIQTRVDAMVEQAFDDQCTGANPRYPLMKEMRQMYLNAYYGTHEPV